MAGFRPARSLQLLRLAGASALLASGAIHLYLYLTSYHSIPTIGPLFLFQTAAAFLLGLALLLSGNELLLLGGAGFAASTLGGYLLSRWVGLFGFKEVPTAAGLVSGLLETFAMLTLGYLLTRPRAADATTRPASLAPALAPLSGPLGKAGLPLVVLAALALSLAAGLGGATETNAPGNSTAATGGSVTVTISNFAFVPDKLTVAPGTVIVVKNKDAVAHTLTAMPGSTPLGNFDTGDINPGQQKSFQAPKSPGSYSYYCTIHNFMTGTLVVRS